MEPEFEDTLFRLIFKNSVDAMGISKHGIHINANQSYAILFGYSNPEELIGTRVTDLIAKEERDKVLEIIERRAEGHTVPNLLQTRGLRKDNTTFDMDLRVTSVIINGEEYTIPNVRDITEQKRVEQALRLSEDIFSKFMEYSPIYVFFKDEEIRSLRLSRNYEQMIGRPLDELLGKTMDDLFPSELAKSMIRDDQRILREGKPISINEELNGRSYTTIKFPITVEGQPKYLAGFTIDITEQKQSEEALRQSQKLESIGTLAGGIAHDFNNLLGAVLGQSSLALNKLPAEIPAAAHIKKTILAAERAADLTRQLLAYSGKGKFSTEDIDLNKIVRENIQMLEISVPKTTQIQTRLSSESIIIRGDIGQLQQVLMNLIINAGEAIGSGTGTIVVSTSTVEITADGAKFRKFTNAPLSPGIYASLKVTDSGSGIQPEILKKIFDPFFSTKFTGRGLGLAAVLGIIIGHKGGLRIETKIGIGTTFEIILPISEYRELQPEPKMEQQDKFIGDNKTILVIDDEVFVLDLVHDILTDTQCRVLSSNNPLDGIEIYRKKFNEISMVVLDFSMPEMDGKTAFEELLKINPNVQVLLCSGYTEDTISSAFKNSRPAAFLQKPFKPEPFLSAVASLLSKK